MPSPRPPARLAKAVALPDPLDVAGVKARMAAIDRALPAGDGIAWFNRLYLRTTVEVEAAIAGLSFRDPRFLGRLDVVFAGFYFEALRRYAAEPGSEPRAWSALFEARTRKGVAPIQFALAGMNAHINRDLPVALVHTCAELKLKVVDGSPQHTDYCTVNGVLRDTEGKVKEWFATGIVAVVDDALGTVDDRIAMWNIEAARSAAWVQGEALWALRRLPFLQRRLIDALDRTVGFAGRGLLLPRL